MSDITYITMDLETYYNSTCTLSKLTIPEYVAHPDFKVHMIGIKINGGTTSIVDEPNIQETLDYLDKTYKHIHLIGQNTAFDGYILKQLYGWKPEMYYDTMAMSRGLAPHAKAGLKHIAIRLWPMREDLRKGDELADSKGVKDLHKAGLFNSISGYCQQDVELTYLAFLEMNKTFPQPELEIIDTICDMFCNPAFKLDMPLLQRYVKLLEKKDEDKIEASGYSRKALSSNVQFAEIVKQLGLKSCTKVSPNTGLLIPAYAKSDISYLKLQEAHPEFKHIWDAREAVKSRLNITRAMRFINIGNATNGVMPVPLRYSAAHTHRLGGSGGVNLQNLTRNAQPSHEDGDLRPGVLRRALLAPEGQCVLVRDLSNIEARIVAYLADQLDLIEQFKNNKDVYSIMAERIYNKPINKKDHPVERGVGKACVLGLSYGMGVDRFTDFMNSGPLGMPPIYFDDEDMYGKIVYQIYRPANYKIVELWKTANRFLVWMSQDNDGEPLEYKMLKVYKNRIELPGGLSLHYPQLRYNHSIQNWEYMNKSGWSKIWGSHLIENICQALAQAIIKANMIETKKALPKWKIAHQCHDEIIYIGPSDEVTQADKTIAQTMATPPDWAPGLPLDSEGGWAENYSK